MKKIFESKIFKNKKVIREEEDLVLNPLGDNVVVTDVTPLLANDTVFNAFQRNMEANGQDQEKAVAATSVELNMTVEQVIDAVKDMLNIPHIDVVNDNDADNNNVVAVVPAETVTGEPIVAVVAPEVLATPEFYEVVANESVEFSLGAGQVLIVEKGEKIRILKENLKESQVWVWEDDKLQFRFDSNSTWDVQQYLYNNYGGEHDWNIEVVNGVVVGDAAKIPLIKI